ncbi:NADPH2:quinone reductase [Deinobacterium chartae]|uniref:NADPH2:quinone reductase n=1 Tax=Deinobacterium chartae TaxID=521158 RepID=A0A841HXW3_9DEIO|nr:NADPH:quinone oxidoreductase family protein [Deinobacterium chartae]MBB6096635.1 NADPH2:quinone reductase [Deinobacterium chartae]
MQAIVVHAYGNSEQLQWREWPDPEPGSGQVRIRTRLTSVNFADIAARRGGYDAGAAPPFVPGLDVVGTVEALGPGVRDLEVGTRVAAFPLGGSYATLTLAPAALTFPVPDTLGDEAVAGLTVLTTAYGLLTRAGRLSPGETVLVHAAAGGVGSTAVQLARVLGAGRVIGTAGSARKCDFVRALGADFAIHSLEEDFAQRVLEVTGGTGADLILDPVSGAVLERGLSCLAPFGRLVSYSQMTERPAQISTRPLHRQNRAVIGFSNGHLRRSRPEALRPDVEALLRLLEEGRLKLQIGARFPLSEAARAHDLIESRQNVGKVLLVP